MQNAIDTVAAAWRAHKDIPPLVNMPSTFHGEGFERSRLRGKLIVTNAAFRKCKRDPDTKSDILNNIALTRIFIHAASQLSVRNPNATLCLPVAPAMIWTFFDAVLLSISRRIRPPVAPPPQGCFPVAISYKHDAYYTNGGTMRDCRTRHKVLCKARAFGTLFAVDVALWIDQGLFLSGGTKGTLYQRGLLPYVSFPVLFCSECVAI